MGDLDPKKSFTLFTRQTCALCDHLVLALELMRPRYDFQYKIIDVDTNPALTRRYGLRVPVLVDRDHEICAGYCDPQIIVTYLSNTDDPET
ncbi:MAG: glutaredoxin family protein [Gammaproteobacteria bacterium]